MFVDLGPLAVVPLADGFFRCAVCGARWWPQLDGSLRPTLGSWRCPDGPHVQADPSRGWVSKTAPEDEIHERAPE